MKQVLIVGICVLLIITIVAFGIRPVTEPLPNIQIAVYTGSGASYESIYGIGASLKRFNDLKIKLVNEEDILGSKLTDCQVLMVPGGKERAIREGLCREGCRNIEKFVSSGGGYVGIGAGAALPTLGSGEFISDIQLINATVAEIPISASGELVSCMAIAKGGNRLLPFSIYLHKGPAFNQGDNPYLPPYVILARFGEPANNEQVEESTPGKDAIIATQFGTGRVLLFSPQPEITPGLQTLLAQGVRWSAGKSTPQTAASGPEYSWEGIFGMNALQPQP
ncbi:hypothetical protein JW926_09195 [Candidatus Sumerlaeota bacterium]|nr:hypothetical protein [Candidatus Sumerlaeota bacterium]